MKEEQDESGEWRLGEGGTDRKWFIHVGLCREREPRFGGEEIFS